MRLQLLAAGAALGAGVCSRCLAPEAAVEAVVELFCSIEVEKK